ncbi:MAG: copper amine oxidase N-terminal domain-containing protein, partial [Clostridiales bacterium]|nr:copper amine oxidase N-terminal domain-containing protein [Clostridiales bacterium]
FDTKITHSFTFYAGWKSVSEVEEVEIDDTDTDIINEKIIEETEDSENIIKVVIGSSEVVVQNNEGEFKYTIDAVPYIQTDSNSTLVPLRFVSTAVLRKDMEKADESSIVNWDSENKTVTITADSNVIQFTSGSSYMTVNGRQTLMANGVKAEITDGRMYVPFRALGEVLGAEVLWDEESKTALFKK